MGKRIWDAWIKPRRAPSICLVSLYGSVQIPLQPHTQGTARQPSSQAALEGAGWGNNSVALSWELHKGAKGRGAVPGTPPGAALLGQAKQVMSYRQEMLVAKTTPKAMVKCFIFVLEKLCSVSYWCREGFDLAVPAIPHPAFAHDEGGKGMRESRRQPRPS